MFAKFFQDLNLPTEEDFEGFDVNNDGILFYDEWLQMISEINGNWK